MKKRRLREHGGRGGVLGIHTYYGGTLRYTLPRVRLDACAMRCVVMSTDERAGTIDSTARKDCRFTK